MGAGTRRGVEGVGRLRRPGPQKSAAAKRIGHTLAPVPQLLAICNGCGTPFPSGFSLDVGFMGSLTDCTSGPCPRCGGVGQIPSGVYEVLDKSIRLVLSPGVSLDDLRLVEASLRSYQAGRIDRDELREQISGAASPVRRLADLLPESRQDWYWVVGILVMLLLSLRSDPHPIDDASVDRIIDEVVSRVGSSSTVPVVEQDENTCDWRGAP